MSLSEGNFRRLRDEYERGGAVTAATARLDVPTALATNFRIECRARTLRPDENPSTDLYDVLRYYSLMEVAAIAQYVPSTFPADYTRRARSILADAGVRAFCELNHLILPQLHLARLRGEWSGQELADGISFFMEFEELSSMVDEHDACAFVAAIDAGAAEPRTQEVLEIVRSPTQFAASLLRSGATNAADGTEVLKDAASLNDAHAVARILAQAAGADRSPVDRRVHGLVDVLFFCRDLDALLTEAVDVPLLRSAMWHYHTYWLRTLAAPLQETLMGALTEFRRCNDANEDEDAVTAAVSAFIASIEHLTGDMYAHDLRAAFEHAPSHPPARARPKTVTSEPWAKITVVLLDRHVTWLDRLAIDIRLKHGRAISRAEIIRALIQAAFLSGIDASIADSPGAIATVFAEAFRSAQHRVKASR